MSLSANQLNRDRTFFDILFSARDQAKTINLIAAGLRSIAGHVKELLTDVERLVEHERFSRAWFLIATADEELGKCHVLLDCIRLDVLRHSSCLMRLSKAYYDHIDKYAYVRLWRDARQLVDRSWWTMQDAFTAFNVERVRLWKAPFSSGWPDMPHDTYFSREANLYVDILENGEWSAPTLGWAQQNFNEPDVRFELRHQTRSHLAAFENLEQGGAFDNRALLAMNEVWKGNYVNEKTQPTNLHDLWCKTAEAVSHLSDLTQDYLLVSPLCFWPCYDALQKKLEIR